MHSYRPLWPIIVMAAGGLLWGFSMARGGRPAIFAGGIFFILFGCLSLLGSIFRWRLAAAWPLIIACSGLAWLAGGFRHFRRAKLGFIVPSTTFLLLGLVFSIFSFKIVGVSFGQFIVSWWPSLLVAGGIVLFVAWGVSRKAFPERRGRDEDEVPPGP